MGNLYFGFLKQNICCHFIKWMTKKFPSYLEKSSISFWINQRGRQRADLEGRDFQGLFILTGNGRCEVAVCSWGYTDLYSVSFSIISWASVRPAHDSTGPFPLLPTSPVTQGLLNIIANDPKLPRLLFLTSQQQIPWPSKYKNTEYLVWNPKGQEGDGAADEGNCTFTSLVCNSGLREGWQVILFPFICRELFHLRSKSLYIYFSSYQRSRKWRTGELRNCSQSLQTSLVSCFRISFFFLFSHLIAFEITKFIPWEEQYGQSGDLSSL